MTSGSASASLNRCRACSKRYVKVFTASWTNLPRSSKAAQLYERSFQPLLLVHFVQRATCHGQPIDQASLHLGSGAADEGRCTAHTDTDSAESEYLRSVQQCLPSFVGAMLFKLCVPKTKVLIFSTQKRETFLVVIIKNAFSWVGLLIQGTRLRGFNRFTQRVSMGKICPAR